jgi:hypothetical protein
MLVIKHKKKSQVKEKKYVEPTEERHQHNGGLIKGRKVYFASESCLLDKYLRKGLLRQPGIFNEQDRYDSGMQLYKDFYYSNVGSNTTINLERVRGAKETNLTERQVEARERFFRALDVLGRVQRDILWKVVCYGETLTDFSQHMQFRKGFASRLLCMALDDLTLYYQGKE